MYLLHPCFLRSSLLFALLTCPTLKSSTPQTGAFVERHHTLLVSSLQWGYVYFLLNSIQNLTEGVSNKSVTRKTQVCTRTGTYLYTLIWKLQVVLQYNFFSGCFHYLNTTVAYYFLGICMQVINSSFMKIKHILWILVKRSWYVCQTACPLPSTSKIMSLQEPNTMCWLWKLLEIIRKSKWMFSRANGHQPLVLLPHEMQMTDMLHIEINQRVSSLIMQFIYN